MKGKFTILFTLSAVIFTMAGISASDLSSSPAGPSMVGIVPDKLIERSLTVNGIEYSGNDGSIISWNPVGGWSSGGEVPGDRTADRTVPAEEKGVTVRPWTDAGGPYGGYVTGLTVCGSDPSILFAGTAAGGVYRSTDGSTSWHPSRSGIVCDWVKQIDVWPSDPDLVYASSSEYWKGNEGDIYRSTDGGDTWTSTGLSGTWWHGVHVSRNDGQRVLAGGELGIYLSTDGGGSWLHRSSTSSALNISCDPSSPDTLYAGSYGYYMYRSTDAGDT